ncbi:MAG: hypothetical protein EPO31_09595 [Gammaproteobacteria bacterium]|jgi:c-di-GMP-binding flagellar brake protein YcgR|nr:MAG: hypothetical protein EPO31_09595 [Gammaproteobacteria bacterium]
MNATTANEISTDKRVEKITDPTRIAGMLREMQNGNSTIYLDLDESESSYITEIVDVNEAERRLWLQELVTREAHEKLLAARKFYAHTFLHSVVTGFACALIRAVAPGPRQKYLRYEIAFPDHLDHLQRREHYRVKVRLVMASQVSLLMLDGRSLSGSLRDISQGGIKIMIQERLDEPIDPELRLVNCEFQLPSGEIVHCKAEIRATYLNQDETIKALGVKFLDIDREIRKAIAKYVATLERKSLQQAARNELDTTAR